MDERTVPINCTDSNWYTVCGVSISTFRFSLRYTNHEHYYKVSHLSTLFVQITMFRIVKSEFNWFSAEPQSDGKVIYLEIVKKVDHGGDRVHHFGTDGESDEVNFKRRI